MMNPSNSLLLFLLGCFMLAQSAMGAGLRVNSIAEDASGQDIVHLAQFILDETWSDDEEDEYDFEFDEEEEEKENGGEKDFEEDDEEIQDDVYSLFTFPYEPSGPSCHGAQADDMQHEYESNLAMWEVSTSASSCYMFSFERVCFKCDVEPIQITVVNGIVTTTDNPNNSNDAALYDIPTMEQMFDMVQGCISNCQEGYMHQCKVQYGTGGSIVGLYMDEEEESIDDESVFYLRDFQTC